MLYSQTDKDQVLRMRKRRILVVWIPTIAMLALSIVTMILFRRAHDVSGWVYSALQTIIGGSYFFFFYGVYLRPVLKYKQHLDYMLDGNKRKTQGILKEVSSDVLDHDGIDCYAVDINIGDRDDPEDDRSFYLDAYKSLDGFQPGDHVVIQSNDRMIAGVTKA